MKLHYHNMSYLRLVRCASLVAAGVIFGAISGCGGGGGGNTVSGIISQLVTRAAGGTVSNGTVSLIIPANSLTADTTVTLQTITTLPSAPSGKAIISATGFVFGPEGTAMAPAGTISIKYNPSSTPASVAPSSLAVYQVTATGYTPLTGGSVNVTSHFVVAPVTSLTSYAILGDITGGTRQAADYAGAWNGTWLNTTFGSTSNAFLTVSVDTVAKTVGMHFQINGNVLGTYNNPPAEDYVGTYNESLMTATANSAIFGTLKFTIDNTGHISGTANTVANTRVSQVQFSGESSSTSIMMNYKVIFRDGTSANGTFNFSRAAR